MEDNTVNSSKQSRIVMSSRVRLARNIDGIPFPVRLNANERMAVNKKIMSVLDRAGLDYEPVVMSELYPYESISLAEQFLISPEFASYADGRVLLLAENRNISIMLNEDDHVRLRSFADGLAPEKAYANALKYDMALDSGLHFAFDEQLGFLNQNPRDLGTGMRASVMLHLPALSKTGKLNSLASMLSKLGISIRGAYGDSASVRGDIFSISNSLSLGISEEDAINNLRSVSMQIETKERAAAEEFIRDIAVRDRINRALGLLSNAVLLTADEMTEMLSWVRLGSVYGLNDVSADVIDSLFITMQPATVNVLAGRKLSDTERSELRAGYVREKLFPED